MLTEQRRNPRFPSVLPVRIVLLGEHHVIETLTKNIGLGGIKCVSPIERPIRTPVSIELTLGFGKDPVDFYGHLVWFQNLPNGEQFCLGIAFDDVEEHKTRLLSTYIERLSSHFTVPRLSLNSS